MNACHELESKSKDFRNKYLKEATENDDQKLVMCIAQQLSEEMMKQMKKEHSKQMKRLKSGLINEDGELQKLKNSLPD